MGDILLIQPPIADFYLTAKRTFPYGLAAIAAALRNEGFSVDILDALATKKSQPLPYPPEMLFLEPFYGTPDISPFALFHSFRRYGYSDQHILRRAPEAGAFLVGISSLFTPYADEALRTAALIRKALPNCRIVLGGHHPTTLPEAVMAHGAVDYVLRGEGEVGLPILAKCLKNGVDLSQVPGIVFRKTDGSLHISAPAMMRDPDRYPRPARDLVNNRYYRRGKRGATVVVTARGCPMGCSYCALGNREIYPYRSRGISSVLEEIDEAILRYDARFIDFEDENLSLNKTFFLSLLREMARRYAGCGLELRAMNGLFPPSLDEEVVTAMKQAGFSTLNLSLGSVCAEQLRRFKRPDVRTAFEHALQLAEKNDMNAVGYIIVGAPGQNPIDSIADLLYLASRRVLAGVSVYYPAPGSADYEICLKSGLLPSHFSLMRGSVLPISDRTTRLETVTLVRLGRIVNFMKHLIDSGKELPSPVSINQDASIETTDRGIIGIQLLSGFLADGVILGVTADGKIYEHLASKSLVDGFLKHLPDHPIQGVTHCVR